MVLFKRFGRIQLSLQAGCNEVLAPPSLFELVVGRGQGENDSVFLGGRLSGACSAPPEGTTIRDNNSACECVRVPFCHPQPPPPDAQTNSRDEASFYATRASDLAWTSTALYLSLRRRQQSLFNSLPAMHLLPSHPLERCQRLLAATG